MRKRMLIALAMVALLVACAAPQPDGNKYPVCERMTEGKLLFSGVCRFVDTDAGVVCWAYGPGGISCLPLKDTRLDQ